MKPDVLEALEQIRRRNTKGLLVPRSVVNSARSPDSPLHRYFEWDDGKAADLWRIEQARELIVRVTIEHESSDKPVQAYVSLPSTRTKKGGGYHHMHDVLSSAELRAEMITSAMHDMENFEERYKRLKELAPVRNVMRTTRKKLQKAA